MKKIVLILLSVLAFASASAQQTQIDRLKSHLYLLAADSLEGRMAGSIGGEKARQYILKQYQSIGLQPYRDSAVHHFTLEQRMISMAVDHKYQLADIVMVIPGNDPVLKDEYIVLGAHYDHLGVKGGQVYNGADDNASGTSALIEIARQINSHREMLKRTVIIAAFDAEEEGLHGSKYLVKMMQDNGDINKVKLMMSIDMVGWLSAGGALTLEGTGTITDAENFMKQLAEEKGINIKTRRFEQSVFTATDTEPFAKAGIPTLAVTTGLKSPYHKPEDDADIIDYEGLDMICNYISELVLRWGANNPQLASSNKLAPKHGGMLRPFEAGVAVGLGSCSLRYPGSALRGKTGFEIHTGVTARLNIKQISVKAECLYNFAIMPTPQLTRTVNDVFDNRKEKNHHSIFVPVTVLWNIPNTGLSVGGGINYSHLFFYNTNTYNTDLLGAHIALEYRVGPVGFSYTLLQQITPNYISNAIPEETSRQSWFTISYYL